MIPYEGNNNLIPDEVISGKSISLKLLDVNVIILITWKTNPISLQKQRKEYFLVSARKITHIGLWT